MKKYNMFIILIIALMMVGCTAQTENPSESRERVTEEDLTVDEYGYNPLTDAQSNLGVYPGQAYSDEGYYVAKECTTEREQGIDIYRLLMFYDNSLEEMYPVCSKADCTHDTESCDAYLSEREYPGGGIWYQNEAVYILKIESAYMTVEKIEKDGSSRTKVCDLAKIQTSSTTDPDGTVVISSSYPEVQLHRGYAYFTDYTGGAKEAHLYRVKLDGSGKAETIDSITSDMTASIYGVKPFGKYVFYRRGEYDANSSSRVSFAIYAYDTETGESTFICDGVFGSAYTVWNNALFYCNVMDQVYRVDLDTGENSLFFEPDIDLNKNFLSLFAKDDKLVYEIDWSLCGSPDFDSTVQLYWTDSRGNYYTLTEQILLDKDGNIVDRLRNDKDELVTAY